MFSLLLLLCVGVISAQFHEASGPLCYDCGGHGHPFPDCLSHTKMCHWDEVCQVKYGGAHTEIKCHKQHDCQREISESGRQCSSGGYVVHGSCQLCCTDDACTTDAANKISATSVNINHLSVHCPASCTLDNLATCVSMGHICNDHQFCKVSVDETNGLMHGKCEDVKNLQHCQDEAAAGHCDPNHHNCIMGCCQDDQCVSGAVTGSSSSSLYELLKGDCQDQLMGDQCTALDASQHLCGDHLAVRVCPKTCGLCSLFNAMGCDDTVANNGCQDLMLSEDICHNDLGKHICPKSCGFCDAMLEEKLNNLLSHQATIVPPDYGALSCSDLANQDCTVLNAVCPTVNCTDVCSKCMMTTTTASGLNALQCQDLVGLDCGVLDAICAKVNCPEICDPCFKPIVTVTSAPVTSTIANVTGGSAVCEDTIQDMNCADVADVCSSPLLVGYCQKFCGLCV